MIKLWKKEDLNLLSEYPKEVVYLKLNILKGLVEEFSDVIYEDKVNTYNSTLYLLSSDYSVTVISKNEETEYLLK